jgi:methylated-DNA-[protein]-cysteine S-methyltransferase
MASVCFQTPFCGLKITENNDEIVGVDFVFQSVPEEQSHHPVLVESIEQIKRYLISGSSRFDLPLNPVGTEHQQRVWHAMRRIPPGEVRTYGEIAQQIGSSPRAVGNACRRNPIPLIIPCHRVVSAQGVGGFAGQTQGQKITLKQQLLAHEGVEI